MTDVRSQQRALQEKTYALEQRMEHERPHLVRVMYGQPLDRIIVSFDAATFNKSCFVNVGVVCPVEDLAWRSGSFL